MSAAMVALSVAIPDRHSAINSARYHSSATGSANATYSFAWQAGRAAEKGASALIQCFYPTKDFLPKCYCIERVKNSSEGTRRTVGSSV